MTVPSPPPPTSEIIIKVDTFIFSVEYYTIQQICNAVAFCCDFGGLNQITLPDAYDKIQHNVHITRQKQ